MSHSTMRRFIDVRELEPCEPMERTLEAVEKIQPGEHVHMLHIRNPHPLYSILEKRGYCWRTIARDKDFDIYIWRRGDKQAENSIPNPGDR